MRCRNCWDGGISHPHHGILEHFDGHVQLIIFLFHGHHKNHPDIGTNREVGSLVTNNQSCKILFGQIYGFVQASQHIAPNGVHLGLELTVQDSITQIFDNNTTVFEDFLGFSDVVQNNERILARNFFHGLFGNVVEVGVAFLHGVEGINSRFFHFGYPRSGFQTFGLDEFKPFVESYGVPNLERSMFPPEASLHGIIYFVQFVRNFGNTVGHVGEKCSKALSVEFSCFVLTVYQYGETINYFINGLGELQSGKLCTFFGAVVHGVQIQC